MRHRLDDAHATRRSAAGAGHVGLGAGFIDKHEPIWIDLGKLLVPALTLFFHVGPILLSGVQRLFFSTRPSSASHLPMVRTSTLISIR